MNSRVETRRSSSRRLLTGFGITLVLLLVVALYALGRLWLIDSEVSEIVDVNNVKSEMLNEMRDSIRQRQYRLREMMIFDDEFEREESWLAYTLAADRFLKARNAYSTYPRLEAENEVYKELNSSANEGVFLERKMVDLLRSGEDVHDISRKAFMSQDTAFRLLEKLVAINKSYASRAVAKAKQSSDISIYTMSLLMSLGLLAGIGVSYHVVSRDRDMLNSLHRQRDELENMKDSASEELASYSYALAHDLTAPLRAVTGYSQILIQEASSRLREEEINILSRVANAGITMSQIIEDMLRLSRITRTAIKVEDVDLSEIAEHVLTDFSEKYSDAHVKWRVAKAMKVSGDREMLAELLMQLFSNAFKFSLKQEAPLIVFGNKRENDRTIFYITDNGVGFDSKYENRVFTPFEKLNTLTDDPGTGIGLALSYRIMRRHQGRIWIESVENEGTTVFFTFPEAAS